MKDLRFPQFDDDVTITGIRHLFRYNDKPQWHVDLAMYPNQEKSHLTTSNAPILARKRVLNPTHEYKTAGFPQNVTCSSVHDFSVKRVGDCPIPGYERRPDARQFCFAFVSDESLLVYLPQFELARVLFFHDQYLSSTAIKSDCLETEFDISMVGEEANITVMPSAGYNLTHLSDPTCRKYLSWVLLDEEARKSFKSIYEYQLKYGVNSRNYRTWDFQFEPPRMRGVKLEVRGHFHQETNCIFVYEIKTIRNLPAQVPENINLAHPDFATPAPSDGKGVRTEEAYSGSSYEIYDDVAATLSSPQTIISAPTVGISFSKSFKVTVVPTKERKVTPYNSEGEHEAETLSVSMEEATVGRGYHQADWNTVEDETEDEHLFENKFECFLSMVDALVSTHGCSFISKDIRKLPKVPRCKKHLLSTDRSPRCIAVVKLGSGGKFIHLLEVDTSDADTALSTQILTVQNPYSWEVDLRKLECELVRKSLNWPKAILTEICGRGHFKGITHPHSPSGNKGVLDPGSIAGWAARIYGWVVRI